jgi:G3E family GTPase
LTSKDHSLKIAVIVNDMAELNIDGQTIDRLSTETMSPATGRSQKNSGNNAAMVVKTKKEVVKLENGCICCTLRGDLIREIHRIQTEAVFDYVLIESTGIAEPQQVAESFCVDPTTQELAGNDESMLWNSARLDTCVTVVDAVNFPDYLSSLKRFQDMFQDGLDDAEEGEGEKSVSELMVEQVEFANVIIINKVDLVSKEKLETTQKLIRTLNPKATLITGSYGKVDLKQILNTNLFSMEEARKSPGWLVSLQDGVNASHGEADEYGVNSIVFRSRKPFHPNRLYKFLTKDLGLFLAHEWNAGHMTKVMDQNKKPNRRSESEEYYGNILRSKGTCWIAGRDEHEMGWAQSGRIIQLSPTASWYTYVDPNEWEGVECQSDHDRIEALFYAQKEDGSRGDRFEYDDRRQELVFIGTDLQPSMIKSALHSCLLTDEEMVDHSLDLPPGIYPDPLAPIVIPCQEAKTFTTIARHNQNQHIRVYSGLSLTLSHLSLNLGGLEQQLGHSTNAIRAVKVWLDKPETVRRGCLLATLRPEKYEQHAMSLKLLPPDAEDDGPAEMNYRIRVELVVSAHENDIATGGVSLTDAELLEACEVHIAGTVEPIPFSKEAGGSDDEGGDHEHSDDDEDCETRVGQ